MLRLLIKQSFSFHVESVHHRFECVSSSTLFGLTSRYKLSSSLRHDEIIDVFDKKIGQKAENENFYTTCQNNVFLNKSRMHY